MVFAPQRAINRKVVSRLINTLRSPGVLTGPNPLSNSTISALFTAPQRKVNILLRGLTRCASKLPRSGTPSHGLGVAVALILGTGVLLPSAMGGVGVAVAGLVFSLWGPKRWKTPAIWIFVFGVLLELFILWRV